MDQVSQAIDKEEAKNDEKRIVKDELPSDKEIAIDDVNVGAEKEMVVARDEPVHKKRYATRKRTTPIKSSAINRNSTTPDDEGKPIKKELDTQELTEGKPESQNDEPRMNEVSNKLHKKRSKKEAMIKKDEGDDSVPKKAEDTLTAESTVTGPPSKFTSRKRKRVYYGQSDVVGEVEIQNLRTIKETVKKSFESRENQLLDLDVQKEASMAGSVSSGERISFKIPKQRVIPNEVDHALGALFGKFTLRQLTEFICDCNGLPRPAIDRSAQPVVRRMQTERRKLVDAHGEVYGKLLLTEKPSFPFVLMQIGEYQGYLPPTYARHPQQGGRPNSIALIPAKERLKYEFTMYNKHRTVSYAVWIVPFTTIEAIHVTNDLLYLRLNQPAQQISSFFGGQPCPNYDVSEGELQISLLHYFRLRGDGEPIVRALLRYNQSFFEPRLVTYGKFFKEVRSMQRTQREFNQESANQGTGRVLAEDLMSRSEHPSIQPFDTNMMIGTRFDGALPPAPSFYTQSQYTVQNPMMPQIDMASHSTNTAYSMLQGYVRNETPRTMTPRHQCFSNIELVDPAYQMSMTPRHHDDDSIPGSSRSGTPFGGFLNYCESDYFPGAMVSQTNMRRDSQYLLGGMTESDYAIPQPTSDKDAVPYKRHFSDLQTPALDLESSLAEWFEPNTEFQKDVDFKEPEPEDLQNN